ncbi:MAG: MFS transporter, partial [Limisphaerales bacterium]
FQYHTNDPAAPEAVSGYRFTSGIVVGVLFAICTGLLAIYKLNKGMTLEMAADLEKRRSGAMPEPQCA